MGVLRSIWSFGTILLAAVSGLGCASGALTTPATSSNPGELVPATAVDGSIVCQSVANRFVGLAAMNSGGQGGDDRGPSASAGRLWVRQCAAQAEGSNLRVRLGGPGWYFVDQASDGIRVTQQVPFELRLVMAGRLHESSEDGVLALWFEPVAEPEVQVDSPDALEVHSTNLWGDFLRVIPGISPQQVAARGFKQQLTQAFREQLRAGVTVTFTLRSGQADATLGRLAAGKTPQHPFEDEPSWAVNDRVLLAPGGSQALGPIDPGRAELNVIVERGAGVRYRAICDQAMQESYGFIANGALSRVPSAAWVASGTVEGRGEQTTTLRVEGCPYYLVASTLNGSATLASIRVRD